MSKKKGLAKPVGTVGFFTFISRILGLLRDMAFAHVFGSGLLADAFFVAFRIPNLLRKLFAEGSLTIAFIPVFSDYLLNKGRERAISLANSVLTLLCIVVSGITVLGIIFSPEIITVTAYGFKVSPEKFQLTVLLTRIMFPYILLISVVALYMGILNTFGHFGAPAAAPIFLNLMMIISIYYLTPLFNERIIGVAIGVLMGGVAQVLLQIPFSHHYGFRYRPNTHFKEEGIKQIGLLILPTLFGSAIYQLNQVIGTVLASLLQEGSVSWLYYADRLVQFPLGVFGVAMGTVSLPSLSRYAAQGNMEGFRKILSQALRMLIFISIPATFGLLVLSEPIVKLFFERGRFTSLDTEMTSKALWGYLVGLLSFSLIRVLVSGFFALKDSKTPVYVATVAMVLNFILGILLMGPLGHVGLAFALSVASTVQAFLLFYILKRKVVGISFRELLEPFFKSLLASVLMGLFLWLLKTYFLTKGISTILLFLKVFLLVILGLLLYLLLAYLLRTEELKLLKP